MQSSVLKDKQLWLMASLTCRSWERGFRGRQTVSIRMSLGGIKVKTWVDCTSLLWYVICEQWTISSRWWGARGPVNTLYAQKYRGVLSKKLYTWICQDPVSPHPAHLERAKLSLERNYTVTTKPFIILIFILVNFFTANMKLHDPPLCDIRFAKRITNKQFCRF